MVTNINQLDLAGSYTYKDYLRWQFKERLELIKGKIFPMSPAPSSEHQEISSNLHYAIRHYLKGKKCKVYAAPFDVRLPLPPKQQVADKITTVVQPDICVICDLSKIDQKGCLGAPDWVIEILSKSTSSKDLNEKFDVYENAGVKEYWIVHPGDGTVVPYVADDRGKFRLVRERAFVREEKVPVGVFPGFEIPLEEVFILEEY